MKLGKIVDFLDSYLEIDGIKDSCWNGLQFEGKDKVQKIAFAVDAAVETFKIAVKEKTDMIIVHHGHFWKNQNPSVRSWSKRRLDILQENNISLYACHLPLDRHRVVGNNAQILKLIGAKISVEFMFSGGKNIGWIGEFINSKDLSIIEKTLTNKLDADCTVLPFGPKRIKRVAVCSGGAGYSGFYEALQAKADLLITGDAVEVYYSAKDAGINIIFAGHHATETIGLASLAKVVNNKFHIETKFIDLPTGL
ncbi:MAG: Nif3-like dinuclear metal center hexameric protein [Candidatus Dadabacteria bacterium]|nr:Nif3-like dinuclear metal center hexameric protein [Candidatus Dadabacteria bacterium]NIS07709.1 Nif3-like dinuclear metal center hexameric protein [Candidatus Dadabacteria bacterium]NIV42288.1 Nif3-like dinuclear metal center hexameric protein [Candidatus Dadabacteria bacterium]NIX14795.1 Nif3-like dinuclear metal center hexameric protein [Candidatus Dadabacteria bacterium]NIY21336.1 Nif3-like dinuclear metal center hexameric protein [Candidatus Dadabacteria bacterium]